MATLIHKPVICPILIGRDQALALLDHALDQARSGRGQVALVAGEAGIGKTRLLSEVRAVARRKGFLVLQGHCFEVDRSLPYAPIIDLLRDALAPQSSGDLAQFLGGREGDLIKLSPDLARWLPGIVPAPSLDPEGEKRRIFQALAQYLVHLAMRQPACLVVEDIHWSDETSLDFLLYFSRSLPAYPLTSPWSGGHHRAMKMRAGAATLSAGRAARQEAGLSLVPRARR